MARISKKDTEWQAGYLNELTGSPLTKGQWLNGKFQTNKGNYYITGAGDFYQLERVVNDWGGRVIILGVRPTVNYINKSERSRMVFVAY